MKIIGFGYKALRPGPDMEISIEENGVIRSLVLTVDDARALNRSMTKVFKMMDARAEAETLSIIEKCGGPRLMPGRLNSEGQ